MKPTVRSGRNKPDLLVVGLGNPGDEYRYTRHNVGFRVVDLLAEITGLRLKKPCFRAYLFGKGRWSGYSIALLKPLTFMNGSGTTLPSVLRRLGITPDRMLVVCDTLDLQPGVCRLKRRGTSAGHRGMASVIEKVETQDFPRLYVGTGRPASSAEVVDFVLGQPDTADGKLIQDAEQAAAEGILRLLETTPEQVMHELNRRKTAGNG